MAPRTICLSVFLIVAAYIASAQTAVEKPVSAASSGSKWQLDVTFVDPQRISVMFPGSVEPRTYWYMLVTVENNTGREVDFLPTISIVTNDLRVVQAGDNIHPTVYDYIRARHEKEYPFLATPMKVTGKLLQGSTNARTFAAVFEDFGTTSAEFTVYATGFSGEIQRVANPVYSASRGDSPQNPQFFILRRTLAITYRLPGDEQTRKTAVPVRLRREWVMR